MVWIAIHITVYICVLQSTFNHIVKKCYEEITMKNVKTIIALLFISSVAISSNAYAGGGKSGDDPAVNTSSESTTPTSDSIWTQLLTGFGL